MVTRGRTPRDELKLIERLASRSGADSAALFGAFDLGAAYYGAGKYNSKRAKIAAALQAARSQGRIDDVLDAVAELVGDEPAREGTQTIKDEDAHLTGNKIFISHASADEPLAGLLQRALILGGVPPERIFYSSARLTGIPAGRDVSAYLRQSLREAGLVIELLTRTFLSRPICLMELGAAWVSETPTFPIVVPPLTVVEASDAIGNVHLLRLAVEGFNQDIFSELHDRISEDVDVDPSSLRWAQAAKEFDAGLAAALAIPDRSGPQGGPRRGPPESRVPLNDANDEFTFDRVVVRGSQLFGEATNHDPVPRSAILAVTFYDGDGEILGSEQAVVNDVRPGRSRTFTFQNVPAHVDRKIEVATLI
jgi:hypothetical protein